MKDFQQEKQTYCEKQTFCEFVQQSSGPKCFFFFNLCDNLYTGL